MKTIYIDQNIKLQYHSIFLKFNIKYISYFYIYLIFILIINFIEFLILCKICCRGLHKRLNNSRHRVDWLASKSDRLSLEKVHGRKLPILMQDIFDLYSFVKVCILLHFRCHQIPFMWGIVGNGWEISG